MSGPVDVLEVLDADGRAVALLSDAFYDAGKAALAEQWSDHLTAHDKARAAVAELIHAASDLEKLDAAEVWVKEPYEDAFSRLRAALALVQGGAA